MKHYIVYPGPLNGQVGDHPSIPFELF